MWVRGVAVSRGEAVLFWLRAHIHPSPWSALRPHLGFFAVAAGARRSPQLVVRYMEAATGAQQRARSVAARWRPASITDAFLCLASLHPAPPSASLKRAPTTRPSSPRQRDKSEGRCHPSYTHRGRGTLHPPPPPPAPKAVVQRLARFAPSSTASTSKAKNVLPPPPPPPPRLMAAPTCRPGSAGAPQTPPQPAPTSGCGGGAASAPRQRSTPQTWAAGAPPPCPDAP